MKYADLRVFYIKDFLLDNLIYKQKPSMEEKRFIKLIKNIKEHGMRNPIIIQKDKGYIVKVGHNRICALLQLGYTTAKVLIACREQLDGEELDLSKGLDLVMPKYHPMDNTWIYGGQYFRILRRSTYKAIR